MLVKQKTVVTLRRLVNGSSHKNVLFVNWMHTRGICEFGKNNLAILQIMDITVNETLMLIL
jgi:hypothetical protein